MSTAPIFLSPVFQERIWGGERLRQHFGYKLPSPRTGECWAISAHPAGESRVVAGPYAGLTLGQLWSEHRYLFGHTTGEHFPLLVKLIDAQADLSVQVHPTDEYAAHHAGGQSGKTEGWYVLDCRPGAEIVYGHTCSSREELHKLVTAGAWQRLLHRLPVVPGQAFEVPSGLIHALGAGLLVYEIQQNSDLTYRLYDYERLDVDGQPRPLQVEQALANVSLQPPPTPRPVKRREQAGICISCLLENQYFRLQKWEITGQAVLPPVDSYLLVSVIQGQGQIQTGCGNYDFQLGDHLLLPLTAARQFSVQGNSHWLVAAPFS